MAVVGTQRVRCRSDCGQLPRHAITHTYQRSPTETAYMTHDDTSLASFSTVQSSPARQPRPARAAAPADERRWSAPPLESDSDAAGTQASEDVIHIRLADSARHQEATSLLIRKMYSWRGYAVDAEGTPAADRITLLAECRGAVVGTMGLCMDGEGGLPADAHFREQLDCLRSQGRMLCEPSRLAIDPGVSKRVFASMIHVSYLYAYVLLGYSDYIIEVNPRHVHFYQHMLGFERVGPVRPCSRVGAPAVLLRLPLSHMEARIRACGGRPEREREERSFYPYFFSPVEEAGIAARLMARRPVGA
jgi:hypothetical protein